MINITCTSCKKVLSIDDAFAGGVCRCQFCGTIQTVPAKGSAQKTAASGIKGSKTLFENKARSAGSGIGSGSGLDDLADIVQSSSGLSDSRLRKQPLPPPPVAKNLTPVLGLAAAVIIILLIVVVVMAFRGTANQKSASAPDPGVNLPDRAAPRCQRCRSGSQLLRRADRSIGRGLCDRQRLELGRGAGCREIRIVQIDRIARTGSPVSGLFWNPDTDSFPTAIQPAFAVKENIDAGAGNCRM